MKKLKLLLIALCITGVTAFGQYWSRTGTNTYLQNSSDKVGIGISSPIEKLHINGSIRGNDAGGSLKIKTDDGYLSLGPRNTDWCHFKTDRGQFFFDKPIFINTGILSSYGNDDLLLSTGADSRGSYRTRITIKNSNGYVGIGTTNPQSMLAVKGTITAQEVIITMDGWPDYVFADNYQLMPLNELESHIKANQHLPGIPSETDVIESGAALGSISASMLTKIEELTLYLIEQNKQIEILKKEVKALKSPKN